MNEIFEEKKQEKTSEKKYSFKEIILAAVAASVLTAVIIVPIAGAFYAQASVLDFFRKIPFLNQIFGNKSSTAPVLNLTPSKEIYTSPVDYESRVIGAVKNASPAVVAITISKNVPIIEQCPYNPFSNLPPEFQQFFGGQNLQFSQPCQKGTKLQEVGGGSGFIISQDGLILTNKHVVEDTAAQYTVLTNDGKKYSAKVLARDPNVDIAVVKIDASNLPTIGLGNSDSIQVGQTAIAIGNALGEFRNTVNVGVVSGLSRNITASGEGGFSEKIYNVIQTDASINPGNSGGPLLNLKGEVIGINTAVAQQAQSIGFAIPVNQVKRIVSDILNFGKIKTPFLGVRYTMVTSDLQASKKLSFDYGALVAKGAGGEAAIVGGSPADKAGLKEGDVILEINGNKLDSDHPLTSWINMYSVGEKISLKIWRNGNIFETGAVLTELPQSK